MLPLPRERRRLIALASLALVTVRGEAAAQDVAQLEGGGSSGTGGYGAALHYWTADRGSGWLGLGFRERLHVAFLSEFAAAGGDSVAIGSAYQRLPLAADPAAGGTLVTQGVSWRHDAHGSAWSAFAGAAGLGAGAPYVSTTEAERPLALLHADVPLRPTLRVVGLAALSRTQTLLPGVVYRPSRSAQSVALTGGIGANAPYGSAVWSYDTPHLRLAASWSEFPPGFRRVDAPAVAVAEPYRENLAVMYDLLRSLRVTAARQSYYVAPSAEAVAGRAVVDRVMAGGALRSWTYSVGVFHSRGDQGASAVSTYSRIETGTYRRLGGAVSYYTTSSRGSIAERTISLEARERIDLGTELLQVVTHSSSGTTVAAGGRVDLGAVALTVDYTMLYVPLRHPDPFLRMINLGLSLRRGNATSGVSTVVDPTGHVSYAANGSTYLYGAEGALPVQSVVVRLQQYVVRGVVRDTAGVPIDGAALRIGNEIVVTDSRGTFLLRTDNPDALALTPAFDEFVTAGRYELVSAPARVTPGREESATPVTVVLRRVRGRPR